MLVGFWPNNPLTHTLFVLKINYFLPSVRPFYHDKEYYIAQQQYVLNLLLYFFHFKISLFSDIKMLVPTFVGAYLQVHDGITINMLAVIVCV